MTRFDVMTCKPGFCHELGSSLTSFLLKWIPIITSNCFSVKRIHFLGNIDIWKTHYPWELIYRSSIKYFLCLLFDNARFPFHKEVNNTAGKVSVFKVILVRIFRHLNCIQTDTEYLFVFSPNTGKYGPE